MVIIMPQTFVSETYSSRLENIFKTKRGFEKKDTEQLEIILDRDFKEIYIEKEPSKTNFSDYLLDLKRYAGSGELRDKIYELESNSHNWDLGRYVALVMGFGSFATSIDYFSKSDILHGGLFAIGVGAAIVTYYAISSVIKDIGSNIKNLETVKRIYEKLQKMDYNKKPIRDLIN